MNTSIARQRYLMDFTLHSMLRRKGRNLVLFTVYCLVIFILASVMFFGQAIRQEAKTVLADAPEATVQNLVMGRHALINAKWVPVLQNVRGVRHAEGRLWGYYYDTVNGANYTVMVPPSKDAEHQLQPGDVIIGPGIVANRSLIRDKYLFLRANYGEISA